jgi:hypothetical protein
MTSDTITRLDVRAILANGGEPFDLIINTAGQVPTGGELELIAPFEPLPLVPHLRTRGFRRGVVAEGHDGVVTRWHQTGLNAQSTLAEVSSTWPGTVPLLGKHGFDMCCGSGKTLEFAARAHGVDLQALLAELHEVVG